MCTCEPDYRGRFGLCCCPTLGVKKWLVLEFFLGLAVFICSITTSVQMKSKIFCSSPSLEFEDTRAGRAMCQVQCDKTCGTWEGSLFGLLYLTAILSAGSMVSALLGLWSLKTRNVDVMRVVWIFTALYATFHTLFFIFPAAMVAKAPTRRPTLVALATFSALSFIPLVAATHTVRMARAETNDRINGLQSSRAQVASSQPYSALPNGSHSHPAAEWSV